MRKMKNNKAVGLDNIPIEAWKCIGREGIEWLTKLFGKVRNTGKMPDEWRNGERVCYYSSSRKRDMYKNVKTTLE